MNRDRLKRLYHLHSLIGIAFGWMVFVVVFSGIPALFYEEMKTWEDPANRIVLQQEPIELLPLLENLIEEEAKGKEIESIFSLLPTAMHPFYELRLRAEDPQTGDHIELVRKWNPNDGMPIAERGEGFSTWLTDFHRNFMIEGTVGRALVGLVGVFLLISVVTGVLTHRKMIAEMFTWRLDRSVRLKWQDTHKILGLWGLPYAAMIAFTGAFLGLLVIMLPATALLVFNGDREAIGDALSGPPVVETGVMSEMHLFNPLRERAAEAVGRMPERLTIQRWGDESAHYVFLYKIEGHLLRYGSYVVSGSSGDFIENRLTQGPGAAWRVVSSITPLHYATYGGIWLKVLYAVLAVGLCVVIATGSMMWLERRLHGNEGRWSNTTYRILGHLTTGIMTGVILTSAALFHVDTVISVDPENRLFWIGVSYFSIWILAIGYTLLRRNDYRACREILAASALFLVAIPLSNAVFKGAAVSHVYAPEHAFVWGVDLAGIVLGILMIVVTFYLPRKRMVGMKSA
ncbi:MAG: PepSY-associated TM helix domain-containing protein [Pseudomonadota bacterium]